MLDVRTRAIKAADICCMQACQPAAQSARALTIIVGIVIAQNPVQVAVCQPVL
jgi:hypothetical protein